MELKWNRFLIFVVFVILVLQVTAQHSSYSYTQDMYEKRELPGTGLDTKKIQQYSQKYNYRKNNKKEDKSNKNAILEHEIKNEKSQSWLNKEWVKALMYAAVILVLISVIFYLFFKGNSVQSSKNTFVVEKEFIEEGFSAEELQSTDTVEMLENALNTRNYRMAVRVQYLRILQILMEKNLIKPSLEKTNYTYVHELQGRKYEKDFFRLTVLFEKIWYGNTEIESEFYREIVPDFDALYNQIRLS